MGSRTSDGSCETKYVELYGGYLTWWNCYEDAQKGEDPVERVPLNTQTRAVLRWTDDKFTIWQERLIRETFSVRGTQVFDNTEKPGTSLDKNDLLRWMWTLAFRAQVADFSIEN